MRERHKRIDTIAREVMCCCLGRHNLSVQGRIERHIGMKVNMIIKRDTEAREDDKEGLIMELDDKSKCAA
eukprot:6597378-Ditylum_brightwellii.AAC.1